MEDTQPPRGFHPSPAAPPADGREPAADTFPEVAAQDEPDFEPGETIGPYRVVVRIGSGGMGIVYKCEEEVLRRFVAVKVVRRKFAGDEHYRRRFQREAQAVAGISHPSLAHVYGFGEFQRADLPRPYLAMEFVEGRSLESILGERGRVPWKEAVALARQAALGLREAWRRGIIHRDVKPSNLLVTSSGSVKIVDFGLSKEVRGSNSMTGEGIVLGTPHYISPEQGRGRQVDHRSDIYSLGATLYHMVAGRPPFEADSQIGVIVAHVNDDPVPPRDLSPELPDGLSRTILKMLAKTPEDRYSDYEALVEDLGALEEGRDPPTAARPLGRSSEPTVEMPVGRGARRPSRRRALVAAASGLAALGAIAAAWLSGGPARPGPSLDWLGSWYRKLGDGRDLLQAQFDQAPPDMDPGRLFVVTPPRSEAARPPHFAANSEAKGPRTLLAWESYSAPFACRLRFRRIDEVRLVLGPTRGAFDLGLAIVDPPGNERRSLLLRLRAMEVTADPLVATRSLEPVPVHWIGSDGGGGAGGSEEGRREAEAVPRLGPGPFEIVLALRGDRDRTEATVRISRRQQSRPLWEARAWIEGTDWSSGAIVLLTPSPVTPFSVTLEKLTVSGALDDGRRVEAVPWRG